MVADVIVVGAVGRLWILIPAIAVDLLVILTLTVAILRLLGDDGANVPTAKLYERAVALAQETSRLSVSLLQRRLGIGYPRAARLLDQLEERGIVPTPDDGRGKEIGPPDPFPRS